MYCAAPLYCKYNSTPYPDPNTDLSLLLLRINFVVTPSASWLSFRSFLDGIHLIPLIIYSWVLILCSLMLTVHDVCTMFPRARAFTFFGTISHFVARHSVVASSTEHVNSLLKKKKIKVLPQSATSIFRPIAAIDFLKRLRYKLLLKRLRYKLLPRMPVDCVLMFCISLQLGLSMLSNFMIGGGDLIFDSIVPPLRKLKNSYSSLSRVIEPVVAIVIALYAVTAFVIAYFVVSLTFRMRKSFMLSLKGLSAHLNPFPEGIREACDYRHASLFIPMFAANCAVSLFALTFMGTMMTTLITLAMGGAGACIALRLLFPDSSSIARNLLPLPEQITERLPPVFEFIDFYYVGLCPDVEPFAYQIANSIIASISVFIVMAMIMRPNFFQLFRTLANNTRDPCFAPTNDRSRRSQHAGKCTAVRPNIAGWLIFFLFTKIRFPINWQVCFQCSQLFSRCINRLLEQWASF